MAEGGQNERASFGKIARSQTKYGTNTKATLTNETYLKHHIKPGDTLQGIALKYGSTMEQIKRVNSIWTNDSLFLREFVLVPLSRSPLQEAPSPFSNGESSANLKDFEIITKQDLDTINKMTRSSSRDTVTSTKSESDCYNEPSPKDYFSKFDSSLAQIRSSVQQLDKASNYREDDDDLLGLPPARPTLRNGSSKTLVLPIFLEDDDNPLSLLPTRRTSRYGSRHKSRSFDVTFGNDDVSAEPDLMFKSHPRSSRAVRNSVERLEKTADDLFQL